MQNTMDILILKESVEKVKELDNKPTEYQEGFIAGCRWIEELVSKQTIEALARAKEN